MRDVNRTILSQYASSPTLTSFIGSLDLAIDPKDDIELFYKNIFDISTASGIGLDIWGRIVVIPRKLRVVSFPGAFGFDEAGPPVNDYPAPWNNRPFFSGEAASDFVILDDESYRRLIMVKAAANISLNTIPNLNTLYRQAIPNSGIWIDDKLDMTCIIQSTRALTDLEIAILSEPNIIPRPAGVRLTLTVQPTSTQPLEPTEGQSL